MQAIGVRIRDAAAIDEPALAQREDELSQHVWPYFDDLLVDTAVADRRRVEHEAWEERGERMGVGAIGAWAVGRHSPQGGDRRREGVTHHHAPIGAVEVVAGVLLHVGAGRTARGRIDGMLDDVEAG